MAWEFFYSVVVQWPTAHFQFEFSKVILRKLCQLSKALTEFCLKDYTNLNELDLIRISDDNSVQEALVEL